MPGVCSLTFTACLLIVLSQAGKTEQVEPLSGKHLFQRCAACHLENGQGVSGMFPPLTPHLGGLAGNQLGRDYLVMVVAAGLMGPINIGGVSYNSVMPAQRAGLGEEGIAATLNYLLEHLNTKTLPADWKPFSVEEVNTILVRYPTVSNQVVKELRHKASGLADSG